MENFKLSEKKVTVLTSDLTDNLWYSSRNIGNVALLFAGSVPTYDLLDCQVLLIDRTGAELLNTQLAN